MPVPVAGAAENLAAAERRLLHSAVQDALATVGATTPKLCFHHGLTSFPDP
jgi:hypothetical protein